MAKNNVDNVTGSVVLCEYLCRSIREANEVQICSHEIENQRSFVRSRSKHNPVIQMLMIPGTWYLVPGYRTSRLIYGGQTEPVARSTSVLPGTCRSMVVHLTPTT